MELKHYAKLLWRWAWLIILGTIVAGSSAYLVSDLTTPVYRATITLLINQATGATPITDYTSVLTSQQLARTYSELIVKRPILEEVIERLELQTTSGRLVKNLEVGFTRDTTLINLSVEHENPRLAATIANEIASVFIAQTRDIQRSRFANSEDNLSAQLEEILGDITATDEALTRAQNAAQPSQTEISRLETQLSQYKNNYTALLTSYEDLRITEARAVDNITVAEPAVAPERPARPQPLPNAIIAAVAGMALMVGLAFLIEYLDDSIKSTEDLDGLQLTNLGIVGHINEEGAHRLVVLNDPRSLAAESFRALRVNIQYSLVDHRLGVLLITSSRPGEGKSTVAANLAISIAQGGRSVALIDMDLRNPSIHKYLQLPNDRGLTTALIQEDDGVDGVALTTFLPNLKVITSGPLPPNPADLLGSERLKHLIEEIKERVDVVVLDSPPCLGLADAVVLSKCADGVLLVLETNETRRAALQQAVTTLRQVGAVVLGVVLNKAPARGLNGYAYHYPYEYYHSNGHEKDEKKKKQPETQLLNPTSKTSRSTRQESSTPVQSVARPDVQKIVRLGYVRVSSKEQSFESQVDALNKAGCEEVFKEVIEDTNKEYPVLDALLACIKAGDVLVVWKIDRLGKSLKQLVMLVKELRARQIGLISINDSIDTTNPKGRLAFNIFASLAEFEHDFVRKQVLIDLSDINIDLFDVDPSASSPEDGAELPEMRLKATRSTSRRTINHTNGHQDP